MTRLIAFSALIWASLSAAATAAPNVVATIKPLHSLAASVMEGVGEPTALVQGNQSPHTFSLRPSDARALQQADLVLWIAEDIESFMPNALASLPKDTVVLEMTELRGITQFEIREEDHGDHGHHDHHNHGTYDSHIWLSHDNAAVILKAIAKTLSNIDPENAARYTVNASKAAKNIRSQKKGLNALLQPVHDRPFMVFHDAYQYFETTFDLTNVGAIHVNPEVAPSAGHLRQLRKKIKENSAVCVLSEPQFSPKLVNTLIEGTSVRTAEIDPHGAFIPAGPSHYMETMEQLGQSLANCLRK